MYCNCLHQEWFVKYFFGDVIQGRACQDLSSVWNTTITLHQSFGLKLWKCNEMLYIKIGFWINYVIPMVLELTTTKWGHLNEPGKLAHSRLRL